MFCNMNRSLVVRIPRSGKVALPLVNEVVFISSLLGSLFSLFEGSVNEG